MQWEKIWGGSKSDWGYAVATDGYNLYLAGHTMSYGVGVLDACLVMTSLEGDAVPEFALGLLPIMCASVAVLVLCGRRKSE